MTTDNLLRLTLRVNAGATGLSALPLLVAPGALESLLGAPAAPILRGIGILFAIVAGLLAFATPRRRHAAFFAILDGTWVVASLAWLALDARGVTTVGIIVTLAIAIVVAVFAVIEAAGARSAASLVASAHATH